MHDETHGSNRGEQYKSDRQKFGGGVMNHQAEKIDAHQRRQFGLAGETLAEYVWDLDDRQAAAGGENDVDQNLKSVRR